MKQIGEHGIRVYKTARDRRIAVRHLTKHGYNYFIGYLDRSFPGMPAGLSYAKTDGVYRERDVFYKGQHIIH